MTLIYTNRICLSNSLFTLHRRQSHSETTFSYWGMPFNLSAMTADKKCIKIKCCNKVKRR